MDLATIDIFTNMTCGEDTDFSERLGDLCSRSPVGWMRSDWANFIAACDARVMTLEFGQRSVENTRKIEHTREVRKFALEQYLEFFDATRRRKDVEASDAIPRTKTTPSP